MRPNYVPSGRFAIFPRQSKFGGAFGRCPDSPVAGIKRTRGTVLRVAARPPAAVVVGLALFVPALAAALGDYRWESWITDGLSLILGGTGAALLLVGLGGTLSN